MKQESLIAQLAKIPQIFSNQFQSVHNLGWLSYQRFIQSDSNGLFDVTGSVSVLIAELHVSVVFIYLDYTVELSELILFFVIKLNMVYLNITLL